MYYIYISLSILVTYVLISNILYLYKYLFKINKIFLYTYNKLYFVLSTLLKIFLIYRLMLALNPEYKIRHLPKLMFIKEFEDDIVNFIFFLKLLDTSGCRQHIRELCEYKINAEIAMKPP